MAHEMRRIGVVFGQRPGAGTAGKRGNVLHTCPQLAETFLRDLSGCVQAKHAGDASVQEVPTTVTQFADSEPRIELDMSIRGMDIVVVAQFPIGQQAAALIELVALLDAVSRASPAHVLLVLSYLPYARQDRIVRSRTPITASVAVDMLCLRLPPGSHVVVVDLHSGQTQALFPAPAVICEGLLARMFLIDRFIGPFLMRAANPMIVSPDAGGLDRARAIAARASKIIERKVDVAVILKSRPVPNRAEVFGVIGDVTGKDCLIVDDMVDTARTLCKAAVVLLEQGATSVEAVATHGVLSGGAVKRILASPLRCIHLLDTIPRAHRLPEDRFEVASCAPLLAQAVYCTLFGSSLTRLMEDPFPAPPPPPS